METGKPRIIFAGTPDFAVPALTGLIEHGHAVVAVYTQPDRPAGRGRKLTPSPVKQAALAADIPVQQPATLRDDDALAQLAALDADLMVVAAYGLLLPPAALQAPRLGCVNIHASLLPRWRGAAPIQRAIFAGDPQSGISIMQMEAGLDTGPVYLRRSIDLAKDETGGSLHDRLAALGAEALLAALPGILDQTLQPTPQDDALATYARKLSKDEARIDWTRPAIALERQVRAFDPWPVAQTRLGDEVLRIWSATALGPEVDTAVPSGTAPEPGRVLATGRDGIDVATGDGRLRITRLQAPGKRPMSALDFSNARHLDGALLG
ncbi:methionyl-tRNA formyltransferase [Thiohalocapsa marina]|uniref:Methionyl-tRNA formyltransferase n=1 Tax=Thiohalocapsa marina TaxID=424902 RepID=A0A5M8FIP5_9GAMM|nr:methionyl-tRNA formyltransferase [Thiohalocapsa marina]KAA6183860.1 methionyl-tRNA formyltransferase [Thiohalocapsa marina]